MNIQSTESVSLCMRNEGVAKSGVFDSISELALTIDTQRWYRYSGIERYCVKFGVFLVEVSFSLVDLF